MCKIFIYIVLIEKERIYDKKWNNYFLPCRNHKLLVLVDVFCIIWQWFIVCLLPFIMYCFIWIQLYAICFIWQTSWIKPSISRNSKYIISRLLYPSLFELILINGAELVFLRAWILLRATYLITFDHISTRSYSNCVIIFGNQLNSSWLTIVITLSRYWKMFGDFG